MFIKSKKYGSLNTEMIQDFRPQFMIQSKKYLIIFDLTFGLSASWQYETEEERNKVLEKIDKLIKSENVD